MNLMRSICCFFSGQANPTEKEKAGRRESDLGQKEAESEKASEERLKHMGKATESKKRTPPRSA